METLQGELRTKGEQEEKIEVNQHEAGITSRPVPTETSRIAVRVPPFWADRPAVWFAQAEAQFTLAGISSEQTKFCYVISQLDQRYASEVEDIITSPPKRGPYTLLRTELVRRLSPSPEQRMRQLFTVEEIGDRKPSQFLTYLKSLAPDLSDNVIRSVWTSRLPRNVQSFLAGQNESNLEAAALCADRISEVDVRPALASVDEPTDIGALRQEIADLSRQVAALSTEQDRLHAGFKNLDTKPRDRGSSPKGSRPAFNNRRPCSRSPSRGDTTSSICWYHRRFGARAQNCTPPCSYSQQGN
ncbi:hypothetical protein B7P43_G18075 [Cryptotermes secundus]|uniref:DUF7041 domain-containing protein n=2 Tax=Cryptotermes secundus TaxID=105785 RepID=A0A2J7RQK2_9NEOP|nr:hypothetical protein B7P43_G18075 [Cryptotermes secundus]